MTPSCVALGRVIICDLNFKRTENHNFTIATNTSQHVEFFHSLIFVIVLIAKVCHRDGETYLEICGT